jgi:membrane protein
MDRAPAPSPTLAQRLRGVALDSVKQWMDDRAASKGAALAYYTLFSLAPMLIIVLAIAGIVFGQDAARGAIFQELRGLVGPDGAQAIQILLANARNPQAGAIATLVAFVLLVVGATTVFGELKESLDEIWRIPKSRKPGATQYIRTRLLSFSVILVLAFLLLVSLAVNAALSVLEQYLGGFWADAAWILQPLSSLISFLVIATLFGAIYKLLPQQHLSWRDVVIGSLGTALLFIIGKRLIGLYLGNSNVAGSYGAAGSVIALLAWVYYSAQIFFLGAEFTRQYALWFGSLEHRREEMQALPKV